jgi:hypothetical protein
VRGGTGGTECDFFLDVGTGLPVFPNIHEGAGEGSRVA